MSFNFSSILNKVLPHAQPAVRLGGGLLGGTVLSEGANAGYRMGTGENLPPAARVALGGVGGASLLGKLSPTAKRISQQALFPAAYGGAIDQLRERTFGYKLSDPKAMAAKMKEQAMDYVKERAEPLLADPRFRDLLSPGGFQFSSLHGAEDRNAAVARVRAYIANRHSVPVLSAGNA